MRCPPRRIGSVFVGIDAGGKVQAREFKRLKQHLPKGVICLDAVRIPRGGSINRSALRCRPAWQDVYCGRDAEVIRAFCDALLDVLAKRAAA
jgi:hypothetical protein